MIHKIKRKLKNRKVKIFLIFLLCSGLALFVSKLSESYTNISTFELKFYNVPKNFLLKKASKDMIDVKLRAIGFQFLGFNIKKGKINIDLSKVQKKDSKYFIPPQVYRKQIDKQLSGSMTLLEVDADTLFLDFYEVSTKKVPVKPSIRLNLAQNYLLEGDLIIKPDTVKITGPKSEIDTIQTVRTEKIEMMNDLASDFSRRTNIYKSPELENTSFSPPFVIVQGKVSRFSEKVIEIPIKVVNLPEGMVIRTFPDKVQVLCKGKIGGLKKMKSTDFQIIADYNASQNEGSKEMLFLKLHKKPETVYSASMLENRVEYILKRK